MKSNVHFRSVMVLVFFILASTISFSQIKYYKSEIDRQFKKHKIVQLNSSDFYNKSKSNRNSELQTNILGYDITLERTNIIHPEYKLRVQTENGLEEVTSGPEAIPMKGSTSKGGKVSLTFANNFVYGYIKEGNNELWIEPLSHYDSSVKGDFYITYESKDLKPAQKTGCAVVHLHEKEDEVKAQIQAERGSRMGCFEVDYAIASDFLMFQKYGSISAVENHNIGVMNNVANNWDNEFADEIQFLIITQFVSSCSTCDPWTQSTSAGVLLASFRNWGPGGFGVTHDLGGLWTNRSFDGTTIGIAYLNAVCTGNRYHCLQDFSNNANLKRVLTSHEIGHNFNAEHDASGSNFIMAPSVNTSNTWSGPSISSIQNHYLSRWCLSSCGPTSPPVANFSVNITQPCAPGTVQYFDQSQGTVTSRMWTFPGGTPSSSTALNPVVTYSQPGVYSATLTVGNALGSNTKTVSDAATIQSAPTADFSVQIAGRTITLFNSSVGTGNFLWEFGDGNTSTLENPVHTYIADGDYLVTLTVTNICGSSFRVENVVIITPPSCNFEATPTSGCNSMTVNFFSNASNNTLFYTWSFPGGNPSVSDQPNPIVTYQTPGRYDVFLTVSNNQFSFNQVRENYITLGADAVANFSYTAQGGVYQFINQSTNANSYLWNFGDGNTSTQTNPTHVYTESGNYNVSLTAINNLCANSSTSQVIEVALAPVAQMSSSTTGGCVSLEVEFENTSINGDNFIEWHFEGGIPSTSTDQNPVVIYNNPGRYNVMLIVGDGSTLDTLILEDYINAYSTPETSFDENKDDLTVNFVNQTQNGVSYTWQFGDGNSSTEKNPVHQYDAQNYWTVTLVAQNECGESTFTKEINTILLPTAAFTADKNEICVGESIQFIDQSTTVIEDRIWTFPGGNPASSSLENPIVTYTTAGNYDVSLEVSNISGTGTLILGGFVQVTGAPEATIGGVSINGNIISLSDVSQGTTSSLWMLPDGETSEDSNINFIAPSNGFYTFELVSSNHCGQSTTSITVEVTAYPTPSFITSGSAGCAPFEVQFTDESANGEEYFWTFEGGTPATSTERNPLVTYENPGSYNVILKVTNQFGTTETLFNQYITVGTSPVIDIDIQVNGFVTRFVNNTMNATSQSWDFGDGSTSTMRSPLHTYTEEGEYTVTLTSVNDCGETTETFIVNIKNNVPVASFSQSQLAACAPTEVEFKDESNNDPTFWSWVFEGGTPETSQEQSVVVQYFTPGVYFVRLTVGNGNGSSTFTQESAVIVYDTPEANFDFEVNQATVKFEYTGNLVETYKWSFGDGAESDEKNPIHTYTEDGVYEVILTVTNACGTHIVIDTVIISRTSVSDINNLQFQILPNPTTGLIKVSLNNLAENRPKTIEVLSTEGKTLSSFQMRDNEKELWMDLNDLPAGLYFIKIVNDTQFGIKKLIKQ